MSSRGGVQKLKGHAPRGPKSELPGGSAIDARTTHHAGYAISQRKRKRVEECFGWLEDDRAVAQGSASWNLQGKL